MYEPNETVLRWLCARIEPHGVEEGLMVFQYSNRHGHELRPRYGESLRQKRIATCSVLCDDAHPIHQQLVPADNQPVRDLGCKRVDASQCDCGGRLVFA